MKLKKLLVVCATVAFVLSLQLDKQFLVAQTNSQKEVLISFNYKKKFGIASNQFAVWIEDKNGKFIKTIFATRFAATGGYKKRPDTLSKWVKSSSIEKSSKKEIDAITKATPSTSKIECVWDFTDSNGNTVSLDKEYVFFVEGTIYWKDNVVYSGIINAKSPGKIEVNAAYSTDDAKKSDMINNVDASYSN